MRIESIKFLSTTPRGELVVRCLEIPRQNSLEEIPNEDVEEGIVSSIADEISLYLNEQLKSKRKLYHDGDPLREIILEDFDSGSDDGEGSILEYFMLPTSNKVIGGKLIPALRILLSRGSDKANNETSSASIVEIPKRVLRAKKVDGELKDLLKKEVRSLLSGGLKLLLERARARGFLTIHKNDLDISLLQ